MHPARLWPGHRHGERAMIVVHHLNNSRSQRILWLLEELSLPYEIRFYQRDPVTNLAPPELEAVHPLGKSPVITAGADVQMSFVGEVARAFGRLGDFPDIAAWVERLHARTAFKAALERGGAYNLA